MPGLLLVLLFLPLPLLLLLPIFLISHHRTPTRRRRKSKRISHTHKPPPPAHFPVDMILVLGGDRHREVTALRLYRHKKIVSTLLPPPFEKEEGEEEEEIFINYTHTPLILSSGALGKEDLLRMVMEEQEEEEEEEEEETITTSIPLQKLTQRTHTYTHTHTHRPTTTTLSTSTTTSSSAPWHSRVHFDRSAVCTLSNFTSLLSHFTEKKVKKMLIVTSSSHLSRALCVGKVVCASVGIEIRGLGIADVVDGDTYTHIHTQKEREGESEEERDAQIDRQREGTTVASESFWRCYRDVVRACVWVCTGKDFRGLVCWVHPSRRPE
jgi:hypothetical protein